MINIRYNTYKPDFILKSMVIMLGAALFLNVNIAFFHFHDDCGGYCKDHSSYEYSIDNQSDIEYHTSVCSLCKVIKSSNSHFVISLTKIGSAEIKSDFSVSDKIAYSPAYLLHFNSRAPPLFS